MSYHWEPATGSFDRKELDRNDLLKHFDSKEAAEEWMSLFYDDLVNLGVAEATLMEEDRVVYGPMSLLP